MAALARDTETAPTMIWRAWLSPENLPAPARPGRGVCFVSPDPRPNAPSEQQTHLTGRRASSTPAFRTGLGTLFLKRPRDFSQPHLFAGYPGSLLSTFRWTH